jgi:site-specific DNA-methyltransferase (adenine-specific)
MDDFKNKIINGDTLSVLKTIPDCYFDAGVTSPPYNKKEKNNGWLVKNVVYDKFTDKMPEEEYMQNQIDVLNEIYRATKEGGHFFYNHKIRWENGEMLHPISWLSKTKWCIRQEIIWERGIAANIRGWRFWQVEERIYWLYKPIGGNKIGKELESKHALLTSIWKIRPEKNINHPAPFPITLPLRALISTLANPENAIVLDPYSGSGSTLIASKLIGASYTGIEISSTYIEVAKERLQENHTKTLEEELKLHKVEKTFKQRKAEGMYENRKKNTLL